MIRPDLDFKKWRGSEHLLLPLGYFFAERMEDDDYSFMSLLRPVFHPVKFAKQPKAAILFVYYHGFITNYAKYYGPSTTPCSLREESRSVLFFFSNVTIWNLGSNALQMYILCTK